MRIGGGPIDAGSALDYLVVGGFGVLGLITVLFYLVRRNDRVPLWLGLFCFALASHFIFRKHLPLAHVLYPDMAAATIAALETAGAGLSLAFLALFIEALHPLASPVGSPPTGAGRRPVLRAIAGVALAASLAALLLPSFLQPAIAVGLDALALAAGAGLAFILATVAWRTRNPWDALLAGMPLLYPVVVLDLLQGHPALRLAVAPFGLAAFIVAPVAVLSLRLARTIQDQAKLTNDLVEAVPVALSLKDNQGRFLFVNRTWRTWFGDGRAAVGARLDDYWPAEKVEHLAELDRAAFARGAGAAPQVDEMAFDGRRYSQTRSVMARADGSLMGILTATIDITERHAQEQQLRDQMALTRALIDENPNAMYLKDTEGRYVTVNDAWLGMVGRTREQAIGRNVLEIFGDEESKRYHAVDMQLIAQGEGSSEVESLRTGPDGVPQWLIIRKAVLRGADGRVIGLVGVNTDITALKRYEKELADRNKFITEMIEALPVSVVIRDMDLKHVQVNRAWERYYGAKREDVIGKRFIEFPGWKDDPELVAFAEAAERMDREALARGPDVMPEPIERRRKGRVYLNTRRALADSAGRPVGVVGVSLDVTDQKIMEGGARREPARARRAEGHPGNHAREHGPGHLDGGQGPARDRRQPPLPRAPRPAAGALRRGQVHARAGVPLQRAARGVRARRRRGAGARRMELARKMEAHAFERKAARAARCSRSSASRCPTAPGS
jgi:PAS domain S-box-containing protein